MFKYCQPIFFFPAFFLGMFPQFSTQYGVVNGMIFVLSGFLSSMIGGIISDRLGSKMHSAKAMVSVVGSLVAFPLLVGSMLSTGSFWMSIGFFAV